MTEHAGDQAKIPIPIVDSTRNKLIHSLLLQMDRAQWWQPSKLRENQQLELRKLLVYAFENSSFWQVRFSAADFDRSKLAGITLNEFAAIDVLSRDELRENKSIIDCAPSPPGHGTVEEMMTSGSTGSPVTVRVNAVTSAMWGAISLRDHLWHRRDPELTMAAIRWRVEEIGLAPDGLSFENWGDPHNQFFETGPGIYLNSMASVQEQLSWLSMTQPSYLVMHPSNVMALIKASEAGAFDHSSLQQLRTVGEALPSGIRELCHSVLGAKLVDFYSSEEVGYIALQCPDTENYHIQGESVYVEVVRDDGSACDEGEIGKVLVTSLRNFSTPLIRYEIGDYAELGGSCSCGRGLPVLNRVVGRVRNMLKLADGGSRWPNLGFQEFIDFASIKQFQLIQHDYEKLELKLVVSQPLTADQEIEISTVIRRQLGAFFMIDLSYHDQISRGAGGKYEDFLCLV